MMTGILELKKDGSGASFADGEGTQQALADPHATQRRSCDELEAMSLASMLYQVLVHRRDAWNGAAWAVALGAENR